VICLLSATANYLHRDVNLIHLLVLSSLIYILYNQLNIMTNYSQKSIPENGLPKEGTEGLEGRYHVKKASLNKFINAAGLEHKKIYTPSDIEYLDFWREKFDDGMSLKEIEAEVTHAKTNQQDGGSITPYTGNPQGSSGNTDSGFKTPHQDARSPQPTQPTPEEDLAMQQGFNQVVGQAAQQFVQGVVDNAVSEIIDNADALIMEALFKQSGRFSQQVVDSANRMKAGYEAVKKQKPTQGLQWGEEAFGMQNLKPVEDDDDNDVIEFER